MTSESGGATWRAPHDVDRLHGCGQDRCAESHAEQAAMVPPMIIASRTETGCSCNGLPNAQELATLWMVPLEMRVVILMMKRGGQAARAECDQHREDPAIQAPTNGRNERKK